MLALVGIYNVDCTFYIAIDAVAIANITIHCNDVHVMPAVSYSNKHYEFLCFKQYIFGWHVISKFLIRIVHRDPYSPNVFVLFT